MSDLLAELSGVFTMAFAVSTLLSMGLGLTVGQVLGPLRNVRAVVAALVVNFALVPLVALALIRVLGLDEDLRIGLLLLATAAGAPMVVKLVEIAKGDVASGVALMTLLILATVVYLPLALPLLLPDVAVNSFAIVRSLGGQMLLPLAIGLFVRWRWEEEAAQYRPMVAQTSTISLALLFVASVGQNVGGVFDLVGTGGILAAGLLIATAVVSGYLVAVPAGVERRVMALGSGQRNLAAAFIVATGNFADQPNVLIFLATAGLISMVLLFPLAGEFSRRPRGAHLPAREAPPHAAS
ncbi:MAG: bile acid:sodium symporter [Dehalococcoidia bacterium]|nr:bile acid:sodium symporter [Dehalococcoidia bacterium]